MEKIPCKFCKELFIPARKWQEFCTVGCRNNYHNDKKYQSPVKCPFCKNELPSMIEDFGWGRFLCNVCSKSFSIEGVEK